MKRRVSPHPLSASSYEDLFRDRRARPVSQFEARLLSGVCRSVERLKNLMASNSWICTVGLKMNWAALQKCIFQHGVNARTPQNSQTSFSEDLFVGIYAAFTVFLVVFYCGNKAAKKNAPTNFKTCWSRCYTNQLHWFLHKLRKKCAPVFTQALQKLVFTPTIPCTQTSFCTI